MSAQLQALVVQEAPQDITSWALTPADRSPQEGGPQAVKGTQGAEAGTAQHKTALNAVLARYTVLHVLQ